MKKLTILLITIFSIYLIYSVMNINKVNYVSITDSINDYDLVIKSYLINKKKLDIFNNYFNSSSIVKTYQDIKNNRTIRVSNTDYYLKKVLRESDVLIINVGMNEISNNYDRYNMKNNNDYFNDMYDNIIRLIKEIKKYAYGKIIFLGYYNPTNYYDANVDRFFYDMDIKLSKLMNDNDIIYIDLYELIKGNNYKKNNSISLNESGINKIASILEFYL